MSTSFETARAGDQSTLKNDQVVVVVVVVVVILVDVIGCMRVVGQDARPLHAPRCLIESGRGRIFLSQGTFSYRRVRQPIRTESFSSALNARQYVAKTASSSACFVFGYAPCPGKKEATVF